MKFLFKLILYRYKPYFHSVLLQTRGRHIRPSGTVVMKRTEDHHFTDMLYNHILFEPSSFYGS
jgi:hypothetical protein